MRKLTMFVSMFILTLLLVACGTSEMKEGSGESRNNSNEKIVITMADHFPTGHFLIEEAINFQERVVELTDDQVSFEYYPGGQLGSISELAGLVSDGAVDLGFTHLETATFLPLSSVTGLPNMATTAVEGAQVFHELLEGPLAEEWENNKLKSIYTIVNPPNTVLSKKKVISTDELEGLKLRASGAIHSKIPEYFKATSVSLNINEIYESMQRGVVDASLLPVSSAIQYHLNEVTDYVLTGGNLGTIMQSYAMNTDVWESLPDNVQAAFIQAGEESSGSIAKLMDENVEIALKEFEQSGITVTRLSSEDNKEILEQLSPLNDDWLNSMSNQGLDGSSVLESFISASVRAIDNSLSDTETEK